MKNGSDEKDGSEPHLLIIDHEDAAVANLSDTAGAEQLHITVTSAEIIAQRNRVVKDHDGAVALPYADIDRLTLIKNVSGLGNMHK